MVSTFFVHGSNSAGKTQWCMMMAGCSPARRGFCSTDNDGWHVYGRLTPQASAHIYFTGRTLTGDEFNRLVSPPVFDLALLEAISSEAPINIVITTLSRNKALFLTLFRWLSTINIKDLFICTAIPPFVFESLTQPADILDPDTNKIIHAEFVLSPSVERLYLEYPTEEPGVFVTDERGNTVQIDVNAKRNENIERWMTVLQSRAKKLKKTVDTVVGRRKSIIDMQSAIKQLTDETITVEGKRSSLQRERDAMQAVVTTWVKQNVDIMEFSRKLNDAELVTQIPGVESMIMRLRDIIIQDRKLYDELHSAIGSINGIREEIMKYQRYINKYQSYETEYDYIQRQLREFEGWVYNGPR